MLRAACLLALLAQPARSLDLFVSSSRGSDAFDGSSPSAAFATLSRAAAAAAGLADVHVRLRRGDSWTIPAASAPRGALFARLERASIGDYFDDGSRARPRLVRLAPATGAALTLADSRDTAIAGLEIVGGEYGVLLEFDAPTSPSGAPWVNLSVTDCVFRGIVGQNYAPGDSAGWGAAVALVSAGPGGPAALTGLTIAHNIVNGSDTAYRNYVYFPSTNPVLVAGLNFDANAIFRASFNALFLSLTTAVSVTRNVFLRDAPARDFTGGTTDIIIGALDAASAITDNEVTARGEFPGEPDGCGVDFETNATGVLFARNFIARAFGAGVMVFGHAARSNRGLRLLNNSLLHNGCGQTVSPDRGAFAFTSPQSSGTIAGNLVATCPGVPFFQDGADRGLPEWDVRGNALDGLNATLALAAAPAVAATPTADGGLLLTAQSTSAGAALHFSTDGARPTRDSPAWPPAGLLLQPGFRAAAVLVKAFLPDGAGAGGALAVESESAGDFFAPAA